MKLPRRIVVLAIIALATWFVTGLRTRYETGVDAGRANSRIHHRLKLPSTASDIDYRSTVWHSRADFNIARQDFVGWATRNDWEPCPIASGTSVVFVFASPEKKAKLVDNGMVFDAMDGDVGYSAIYDETNGRASIQFSSR